MGEKEGQSSVREVSGTLMKQVLILFSRSKTEDSEVTLGLSLIWVCA